MAKQPKVDLIIKFVPNRWWRRPRCWVYGHNIGLGIFFGAIVDQCQYCGKVLDGWS